MKTINLLVIFIIVALVQIFVPAQMIFNQEKIIDTGVAYKFKTQPIDPSDPFRGKYIVLNYEVDTFKTSDSLWNYGEDVYVYLNQDSLGFAQVNQVSKFELKGHKDYVMAEVNWYNRNEAELHFNLPFDRYYMEETKAYDAELAVRNSQRDSVPNSAYALVYVKEGEAVLDDVIINQVSIKDFVEKKEGSN